jgi:pimeloyl-ACP methyl ester carboxylesterase
MIAAFAALNLSAYRHPVAAQSDPQIVTQSVDIDGRHVRVRVAGLRERVQDQAVVIFESGGATPLETWDSVLPVIASFAPVLAYDRAGIGESTWDSVPPTPQRVVSQLRHLLEILRVPPPYILVGHSWGGALVRYFAAGQTDEVVGVLYIDPMDITLTKADMLALFRSIGAGAEDYEAFNQTMQTGLANLPAPMRAEGLVVSALLDTDLEARGLGAAPDVPTSVIVAGQVTVLPRGSVTFDPELYARAMQQTREQRLRAWTRAGGTFQVAERSGHFVHSEVPELVISAVRELVRRR